MSASVTVQSDKEILNLKISQLTDAAHRAYQKITNGDKKRWFTNWCQGLINRPQDYDESGVASLLFIYKMGSSSVEDINEVEILAVEIIQLKKKILTDKYNEKLIKKRAQRESEIEARKHKPYLKYPHTFIIKIEPVSIWRWFSVEYLRKSIYYSLDENTQLSIYPSIKLFNDHEELDSKIKALIKSDEFYSMYADCKDLTDSQLARVDELIKEYRYNKFLG